MVASMAVKDKEALLTLYTTLSIFIEMLNLFKTNLVISLAIFAYSNALVI